MITPGLASVSFRRLSPADIVKFMLEANLEAVEWGGDVHVPHGDTQKAAEVRRMTEDAGLKMAAYGSYHWVGLDNSDKNPKFETVLDTAVALGAETIRVWAGDRSSQSAPDSWWKHVVRTTRQIADLAQTAGLTISFEFHQHTLNDCVDGARRLFRSVEHENVRSYWQPSASETSQDRLHGLTLLRKRLSNVHVFQWVEGLRRPLVVGESMWRRYLQVVAGTGRDHYALLEFVRDDMPGYLIQDASTLRGIIRTIKGVAEAEKPPNDTEHP